MKKINLLLSVVILTFAMDVYSANVSGIALLDNSTIHSDILIKFIPVSPSAVLDSAYTNQSGSFSLNVENGVYDITYTKTGCLPHTLQGQLLNDIVILDTIILSSTNIIYISENVAGIWNNENTYIVTDNISINQNDTLIISSGTEVKFDGYFNFSINGVLMANGTSTQPILFTSNNPSPDKGDWKGLIFNETNGLLSHTIIEYTGGEQYSDIPMVRILNSNLTVEKCIFRHSNEVGIAINGGTSIIKESDFFDFDSWAFVLGADGDNTIIENNLIHNNTLGMIARGGVLVRHNRIYSNSYGVECKGPAIFEYNIFYDNSKALYSYFYGNPLLINNTFNDNYTALEFQNDDYGHVFMNVFSNNTNGILIENITTDFSIEYNIFHNNEGSNIDNPPVGFGSIVTNNNNGTPCDSYYNIFENPEYLSTYPIDNTYLHLGELSPAIDAGNPEYLDPDSTIRDIGAIPFILNSSIDQNTSELDNFSVIPFPNPFSNKLYFEIDLFVPTKVELKIYDIIGICVKTISINNNISKKVFWDTKDKNGKAVTSGTYIYRMGNCSGIIIKK